LLEAEFGPAAIFLFPRLTSSSQRYWRPIIFQIVKNLKKKPYLKVAVKKLKTPPQKYTHTHTPKMRAQGFP
jgi:hypothetical protein